MEPQESAELSRMQGPLGWHGTTQQQPQQPKASSTSGTLRTAVTDVQPGDVTLSISFGACVVHFFFLSFSLCVSCLGVAQAYLGLACHTMMQHIFAACMTRCVLCAYISLVACMRLHVASQRRQLVCQGCRQHGPAACAAHSEGQAGQAAGGSTAVATGATRSLCLFLWSLCRWRCRAPLAGLERQAVSLRSTASCSLPTRLNHFVEPSQLSLSRRYVLSCAGHHTTPPAPTHAHTKHNQTGVRFPLWC